VTAGDLMALAPEAWETLTFTALPSLRRLALAFDVPQAWQRRAEVEPGNLEVTEAADAEAPVAWVIWRPERTTQFRSMPADEAAAFDALARGESFPDICEALAPHAGEADAPSRAAQYLRGWVEAGMIATFRS
jgi:hypothetical protein